jgi:SsrA-binding protein
MPEPGARSRSGSGPRPTGEKRVVATNRKARHDYFISHVVEAGLLLLGSEVKSLRQGGASIADGFARLEDGELWLRNVHIPPLPQASYRNHEPLRRRKCLIHRRELRRLEDLVGGKGTTMVPLSLYFRGPRVKVEIGVGRGKAFYDKRADERKREAEKETRRAVGRGR